MLNIDGGGVNNTALLSDRFVQWYRKTRQNNDNNEHNKTVVKL